MFCGVVVNAWNGGVVLCLNAGKEDAMDGTIRGEGRGV